MQQNLWPGRWLVGNISSDHIPAKKHSLQSQVSKSFFLKYRCLFCLSFRPAIFEQYNRPLQPAHGQVHNGISSFCRSEPQNSFQWCPPFSPPTFAITNIEWITSVLFSLWATHEIWTTPTFFPPVLPKSISRRIRSMFAISSWTIEGLFCDCWCQQWTSQHHHGQQIGVVFSSIVVAGP